MSDQPENTPAGSYRVAGNDTSHYLGVDNEYMNYADETQKPSLTEEEQFLYLPVPVDESVEDEAEVEADEDEAESDDDEDAEEYRPTPLPGDFVEAEKPPVTLTPTRPAL